MHPVRPVALLAACALALAACSSGSNAERAANLGATSTTHGRSALKWRDCDAGECATLRVPLDPAVPGGDRIGLKLARVRASNPDERIGSLLFNPGGPGASGADYVPQIAGELPKAITDRFDVVGWDPRGSGASDPVDCGKRLDYLFKIDTAPDDDAERVALVAASTRFARACSQRSGDLLAHISSLDTVHDMDRIREALGDEKLTFAGFSYGTYLGALYAHEYPDRVRALLLDGAVDPAVPVDEVSIQQAKGFESSFDTFLRRCAKQESCAFHHGGHPRAAIDRLRARIEREPMRARDGQTLGPTQLDIALAAPLYSGEAGYSQLAHGLRQAEQGKPSKLLEIFDDYVVRYSDGTYAPEWAAFLAISCADGPVLDATAVTALQARAAHEAPYFGASNVGLGVACSYWPVPAVNRAAGPISAPGAPPIVVVGTTGDPATPVAWAEGLAQELGAHLVTVEGSTHTSSLDGNPCLDRAITRYLVDLRPPRPDLRCRA